MQLKALSETVSKIEQRFDVNSLCYKDMNIWPLIRLALDRQALCPGEKIIKGASSHVPSLRLELKKEHFTLLRPYHQTEMLFHSLNAHHIDHRHEKFYDRFIDPLIDLVKEKYSFLKLELHSPKETLKLPRFEPTIFIDPPMFLKNDNTSLPVGLGTIKGFAEFKKILFEIDQIEIDYALFIEQAHIIEHYQHFFEGMLCEIQPKVVFFACYYTLGNMALIRACRQLGITSVDIQHGIVGEHHVLYTHWESIPPTGYDLVPDYFWMWGERDRGHITGWQPQGCRHHRAIVGGNRFVGKCKEDEEIFSSEAEREFCDYLKKFQKVILVSLQWTLPLQPHLIEAMKRSPQDWLWLIRLHPNQRDEENQINGKIREQGIENCDIRNATSNPLYLLLTYCDHHVTGYSSVSYEALAFNVPTTIIHPLGFDVFEGDIKGGVFSYATGSEDLLASIAEDSPRKKSAALPGYIETDRDCAEEALNRIWHDSVERSGKFTGQMADEPTLPKEEFLPSRALALGQEGAHLLNAGKPALALQSLDRSLSMYRKNHDIHYARALALKKLKRLGEAIEAARTALAMKPDHQGICDLCDSLAEKDFSRSIYEGPKSVPIG